MQLQFLKMHGLGNDFVVFDGRKTPLSFSRLQIETMCNRRFGIGCDQLIIMEGVMAQVSGVENSSSSIPDPQSPIPDIFMRIYNSDGGEIDSCGNATRCVAWLIMEETGKKKVTLQTNAGLLECERIGDKSIMADMGMPRVEWKDIPLSKPCDTLHLPIGVRFQASGFSKENEISYAETRNLKPETLPVAVGMGNPHMVFIVPNVDAVDVAEIGAQLEYHPLFPERANVSFAQAILHNEIKLRVWERGAGQTLACGTAACASLVALHRRGLTGTQAKIKLPGGVLDVRWDMESNHIFMTGEVALVYSGQIHL